MTTGIAAIKEKVPSMAWLARELGITRGAVQQWDKVPAERLGEIARVTGLSPNVLRPDLFATTPPDEKRAEAG